MPYKEKEIKKLYYSIGEVSKMLDVKPTAIRSWEKQFKHINPRKNRKGDRMFTEKEIYDLKVVRNLVQSDTTQSIKEVKTQLKDNQIYNDNIYTAIKRLEKLRYEMVKLKEQLRLKS